MPCTRLARLSPLAFLLLTASAAHAAALTDPGQVACYDASTTSTGTVSSGAPAPESAGFEAQDCSLGVWAPESLIARVGALFVSRQW